MSLPNPSSTSVPTAGKAPHVAIIGGGLIGVMLGLGLAHSDIPFTIYERAANCHETGAGIALTSAAKSSMERLHPNIFAALREVTEGNHFRFWDGFHPTTKEGAQSSEALYFLLDAPGTDYWCCKKSDFLSKLVDLLPSGSIRFNKELESYVDGPSHQEILLRFADGSTAEADVLLGCDGIQSRTRQLLLGKNNPAAHANFAHQAGYRALFPISEAMQILGDAKGGRDYCVHIGPDAYLPSYPMLQGTDTVLSVTAIIYSPDPWSHGRMMVAPATRDEVTKAFRDWSPHIRDLIGKFPENLMKWGIFDMADHPAPTYASGRIAILGDAAHASTPFLGAGCTMGIEDALAMVFAMQLVNNTSSSATSVATALQAFNASRRERSQWLVQNSRDMGVIFQGRDPSASKGSEHFKVETEQRMEQVWSFDVDAMTDNIRMEFEKQTAGLA